MYLTIDGQRHALTPVQAFRVAHDLPATFGVAYFEPKDFTGLAALDARGAALDDVRAQVLAALPDATPLDTLLPAVPAWCGHFRQALERVNETVKLKQVEIDYAVNGFEGVLQAVAFAWMRSRATQTPPPSFAEVYAVWLDDSVRISQRVHTYVGYMVQVINTAYGRAGLVVRWGNAVAYVHDAALGCPAEGFMVGLLRAIVQKIVI
jgi:hypothetical protein